MEKIVISTPYPHKNLAKKMNIFGKLTSTDWNE